MRKIYKMAGLACLGLVLASQNINAQTVSDFESQVLAPNSFINGNDMSGAHNNGIFELLFNDGDAIFPNVFDTTFGAPGFWSGGFGISNMTDSVTSGFLNLSSARAGSGVNNSSNYLMSNNNSMIHLTGTAVNNAVSGVYITNGTYAANSMRDGDFSGKVFGNILDANGVNDGTNGEDWFLLTIKGYTGGNLTTDSVNFYLADYRFSDNTQDYIVKDWRWVDLTSLGAIDSLQFNLSSSDLGQFGINTPTFFALDNFNDQSVSVDQLSENNIDFTAYPNPVKNNLTLNLNENIESIYIVDVTGKTVLSESSLNKGIHSFDTSNLKNGVYFIRAISNNKTKIEKFIKN